MSGYSKDNTLPAGASRYNPFEVTHLMSGMGPRNAMMLKYTLITMMAEKRSKLDMLQAVGKRFSLRFVVFERQGEEFLTGGNAFQPECDASLNNNISGRPDIANIEDIPHDYQERVTGIIDLQKRIAEDLQAKMEEHAGYLEAVNVACASLFKNAVRDDGTLDGSRAFTARSVIGRVQFATVKEVLELAEEVLPETKVEFYYHHSVVDKDYTHRSRLGFVVHDLTKPDTPPTTHYGHFLHYANGTTWQVPFDGEVGAASFSGVPGSKTVGGYFEDRNLLREAMQTGPPSSPPSRTLVPGVKIGISGLGLSAFDMVCIAANYTTAVKVDSSDPRRWRIDPEEAAKYPGVFQFFSRSNGVAPPPRYTYTQEWYGKRPALNTRQVHALLLQRGGFDWLSFAKIFVYANAARTLGIHPDEVNKARSTEEMFANYRKQTEAYYANPSKKSRGCLEAALLRSQYQALANGGGIETDPRAAEEKLVSEAPHSRTEVAGWPIQRAMIYDITRPHIASRSSNDEFVGNWRELQLFLTASPPEIHDLVAAMFEHGMAAYTNAAYSDVGKQLVQGKINLKGKLLDGMLASRVLTSDADQMFKSLKGEVMETIDGQPDYAKGRVLRTPQGDLLPAFDNGSGGSGKMVVDAHGKMSLVGAQWQDTNAHLSANQQMPINALSTLMASTLLANGDERPLDTMNRTYRDILPKAEEFDAETATFKSDWEEIHAQFYFLTLCKDLTRNGEEYFACTQKMFTAEDRADFVARCNSKTTPNRDALAAYKSNAKLVPLFEPKSLDEFEKQFVDYRPAQVRKMWDATYEKIVRS